MTDEAFNIKTTHSFLQPISDDTKKCDYNNTLQTRTGGPSPNNRQLFRSNYLCGDVYVGMSGGVNFYMYMVIAWTRMCFVFSFK